MEFMRRTMFDGVMPSAETLKRHIRSIVGNGLEEAGFTDARFKGAIDFFVQQGYRDMIFFVCTDATSVLPAVVWRADDDALLGYAVSDHELPLYDIRAGVEVKDILAHHARHRLATQVELVLLCALAPGFPAYTLAAFPQTAAPPALGVKQQVEVAIREIEKHGAICMGYAADGASAQLSYMKEVHEVCFNTVLVK